MSSDRNDGGGGGGLQLEDAWVLFFHDPDDRSWTLDSYTRVCSVSSAEEFWGLQRRLAENNALCKGMWFLMRDEVFPCWDDSSNIDGGCISFMVANGDVPGAWQEFCEAMLCGRMLVDGDDRDHVNGLSVSPKHDFCIIKVWFRTTEVDSHVKLRVGSNPGIFTSNRAKMANVK